MKQPLLLFDLDGTLTDSGQGITNSAAYALRHFGIHEDDPARLNRFVGPPLKNSFMDFYGFDEEKAERAITYYREYFTDRGIHENRVYDGVEEMLQRCQRAGKQMALATSKPTVFAEKIVEGFGLAPYFTLICGSNLDGTRSVKAEIIEQVLFDCKARPKDAVMIGDRKHDLIGAKRCGIASVGVLYGYGSREEMEEYGADYIVPTVPALADLLCG